MKRARIIVWALAALFITACASKETSTSEGEKQEVVILEKLNKDNLLKEIKKREEVLSNDTAAMSRENAKDLMDAYRVYADRFAAYEHAGDYLFKAGEIAMGLNLTAESIRCFEKVYTKFTSYEKRPYALFLKAFVLENQAQNFEEAKVTYELFLSEFPQHEMADDAQYSIKNMGKTPEELIREFEIQDSLKRAEA